MAAKRNHPPPNRGQSPANQIPRQVGSSSRLYAILLLSGILLFATLIRFWRIGESEFIYSDEYIYYIGVEAAKNLNHLVTNFSTLWADGKLSYYGVGVIRELSSWGRPVLSTVNMFATLVLGNEVWVALAVQALAGVLTVGTICFAGIRLHSWTVGLLAALILSVDGIHVIYSRLGLATSLGILLFTITMTFYITCRKRARPPRGWMLWVGVGAGLAVLAHPNLLFYLPLIPLMELPAILRASSKRFLAVIRSWGLYSLGVISSILLAELPYFGIHSYFAAKGRIPFLANYFQSLKPINNLISPLNAFSSMATDMRSMSYHIGFQFFLGYLRDANGLILTALYSLAVLYCLGRWLRNRRWDGYWIAACWALYPYVYYSLSTVPLTQGRYFAALIPGVALAVALLMYDAWERLRRTVTSYQPAMWVATGSLCLVIGVGFSNSLQVINSRLDYSPISSYIREHSLEGILVNANVHHHASPKKVVRHLPNFRMAPYIESGQANPGRAAVCCLDPMPITMPRWWLRWKDIQSWSASGKIRYLLTSPSDDDFLTEALRLRGESFLRFARRAQPLFSIRSPFADTFRWYDSIGFSGSFRELSNIPYFRVIGIYDLSKNADALFGPSQFDTEGRVR